MSPPSHLPFQNTFPGSVLRALREHAGMSMADYSVARGCDRALMSHFTAAVLIGLDEEAPSVNPLAVQTYCAAIPAPLGPLLHQVDEPNPVFRPEFPGGIAEIMTALTAVDPRLARWYFAEILQFIYVPEGGLRADWGLWLRGLTPEHLLPFFQDPDPAVRAFAPSLLTLFGPPTVGLATFPPTFGGLIAPDTSVPEPPAPARGPFGCSSGGPSAGPSADEAAATVATADNQPAGPIPTVEDFLRQVNPGGSRPEVPTVTVADLEDGGAPWPTIAVGSHHLPDGRVVTLLQPADWTPPVPVPVDASPEVRRPTWEDRLPPLRAEIRRHPMSAAAAICVALAHPTWDGFTLQVAEEYQRQGIGSAIFRYYLHLAPDLDTGGLSAQGEALARAVHRHLTAPQAPTPARAGSSPRIGRR